MKNHLESRLRLCEAQIEKLQKELRGDNCSRLCVTLDRGKPRYYEITGSKKDDNYSRKYLSSDSLCLKELEAKTCKRALLDDLLLEKKTLERCICEYEQINNFSSLCERIPDIELSLLKTDGKETESFVSAKGNEDPTEWAKRATDDGPARLKKNENLAEWAKMDYPSNAVRQNEKTVRCINGLMVRSKSEAAIVSALIRHGIPFRYECDIKIGETVLCPDFTIRHPATGEYFIWEHFGLYDITSYFKNCLNKIYMYKIAGYTLGNNLIITSEMESACFDEQLIDKLVESYFG